MQDQKNAEATEMGFFDHLRELRDRLLRIIIAIVIGVVAMVPFGDSLYHWLAGPLLHHLPEGSTMIATKVTSPFLIPFKLSMMTGILLVIPYLLYQLWAFIAPGLYLNERKIVFPLLFASIALFAGGMAFAYFIVFPIVFAFFINAAPEGVAVMTDISEYLDFVIALFFAFGLAFQVPIATILLLATGVVSRKQLANARPYVIVGAFVLGMLLTPPDVISQILLAVPMWLLFELGVFLAPLLFDLKKREAEAEAEMDAELDKIEEEQRLLSQNKQDNPPKT
jgi:sec-independent protein translocase protein TatC